MIEELLARHQKIALQFSGGKDSMAVLYLMRPYLSAVTVYWLNSGDEFPETHKLIEKCREWIPNFVEVKSDSVVWRGFNGASSDLVPTYGTPIAKVGGFGRIKISDRFACCFANVMLPMYLRMKQDGITCIIRGQKLVDMPKVPFKSGDTQDGFEFYYPIESWANSDVFDYLKSVGAQIHPCYEFGETGTTCKTCTAWWNESQHEFRRVKHPEIHAEVAPVMAEIRSAINEHLTHLGRLNYGEI